jgi:hypothetical protein
MSRRLIEMLFAGPSIVDHGATFNLLRCVSGPMISFLSFFSAESMGFSLPFFSQKAALFLC